MHNRSTRRRGANTQVIRARSKRCVGARARHGARGCRTGPDRSERAGEKPLGCPCPPIPMRGLTPPKPRVGTPTEGRRRCHITGATAHDHRPLAARPCTPCCASGARRHRRLTRPSTSHPLPCRSTPYLSSPPPPLPPHQPHPAAPLLPFTVMMVVPRSRVRPPPPPLIRFKVLSMVSAAEVERNHVSRLPPGSSLPPRRPHPTVPPATRYVPVASRRLPDSVPMCFLADDAFTCDGARAERRSNTLPPPIAPFVSDLVRGVQPGASHHATQAQRQAHNLYLLSHSPRGGRRDMRGAARGRPAARGRAVEVAPRLMLRVGWATSAARPRPAAEDRRGGG